MVTECAPFDDDDYNAAEQQRDMEEHRQFLQMTYAQLHRRIKTGEATVADLVSLDILARDLELDVIPVSVTQPVDYPLSYGGTD